MKNKIKLLLLKRFLIENNIYHIFIKESNYSSIMYYLDKYPYILVGNLFHAELDYIEKLDIKWFKYLKSFRDNILLPFYGTQKIFNNKKNYKNFIIYYCNNVNSKSVDKNFIFKFLKKK